MDADGGRAWWPPAHSWAERRDEALALRSSRYSWRLPILLALMLLLLGTTLVRGLGRADPVAIGVPLVLGAGLLVVLAKALDIRIERRDGTVTATQAPALRPLLGLHGLDPFDPAEVPSWLVDVRALRERDDDTPVRVVAALRRKRQLVVALVAGGGARELVVVRRLPVDVGAFAVRPRRRPDTRVGARLDDLYDVAPGPGAAPSPLAAWLVTERPQLRLESTGEWLVLRPAAEGAPVDGDALAAIADELIATADKLVPTLGRAAEP